MISYYRIWRILLWKLRIRILVATRAVELASLAYRAITGRNIWRYLLTVDEVLKCLQALIIIIKQCANPTLHLSYVLIIMFLILMFII